MELSRSEKKFLLNKYKAEGLNYKQIGRRIDQMNKELSLVSKNIRDRNINKDLNLEFKSKFRELYN